MLGPAPISWIPPKKSGRKPTSSSKSKSRLPPNTRFLRPGLILFTYLHLAAEERLTRLLLDRQVTAIGYETIQLEDGSCRCWRQ